MNNDSIVKGSRQVKFAIDLWNAYENNCKDLDECIAKYDADGSGDIDKDELTLLLSGLNDGHAPTVVSFVSCIVFRIGSKKIFHMIFSG